MRRFREMVKMTMKTKIFNGKLAIGGEKVLYTHMHVTSMPNVM